MSGKVYDADNRTPISGCVVSIIPGNRSVSTNVDGFFDFGTIDIGQYTLTASFKGYCKNIQEIIVESSKTSYVEFIMERTSTPKLSIGRTENIFGSSATLSADILSTGGEDIIEAGFYYGTDLNVWHKKLAEISGNTISCVIEDLKPLTNYYFQAYARNNIGESVGELSSFSTTEISLSSVVTEIATNISENSVTLNASIPSGSDAVETCGFYLGTSEDDLKKYMAIYSKKYFLNINNLTSGVTYYYKAFVANDKAENVGEIKTFKTLYQEYQGHYYVDLGLPSGIKWACYNMGALTEESTGDYYSWAEISPKTSFDMDNYKYMEEVRSSTSGTVTTKEFVLTKYTSDDRLKQLDASDDAAHIQWGGQWRLPSQADFDELIKKCTWKWTSMNGKDGYLVTGSNNSYIFLPMTGYYGQPIKGEPFHTDVSYYWASTLASSTLNGVCLEIDPKEYSLVGFIRFYGFVIRPVFK